MNRRDFLKRFAYVPLVAAAAPVYFLPPKGGWVSDLWPHNADGGCRLNSFPHPFTEGKLAGCHYDIVRMIYEVRTPTVLHVTDPLGRAILANEELARVLLPSLTAKPYTLL